MPKWKDSDGTQKLRITSDRVAPPIMKTKIRCPMFLKSVEKFLRLESLEKIPTKTQNKMRNKYNFSNIYKIRCCMLCKSYTMENSNEKLNE